MTALPDAIRDLTPDHITELDVREDLRNGREPFSRIMQATRALQPGRALSLRAIFEPVPLYAVMERMGFACHTERLDTDDWRVWIYPAAAASSVAEHTESESIPAARPAESAEACAAPEDIVLDVRGLEPPEPMLRTLQTLEALLPGQRVVQLNDRVPQFLLPQLRARGAQWDTRELEDGTTQTIIWK